MTARPGSDRPIVQRPADEPQPGPVRATRIRGRRLGRLDRAGAPRRQCPARARRGPALPGRQRRAGQPLSGAGEQRARRLAGASHRDRATHGLRPSRHHRGRPRRRPVRDRQRGHPHARLPAGRRLHPRRRHPHPSRHDHPGRHRARRPPPARAAHGHRRRPGPAGRPARRPGRPHPPPGHHRPHPTRGRSAHGPALRLPRQDPPHRRHRGAVRLRRDHRRRRRRRRARSSAPA